MPENNKCNAECWRNKASNKLTNKEIADMLKKNRIAFGNKAIVPKRIAKQIDNLKFQGMF